MVDLTTTYLGLKLKTPLVASASPLSRKIETVQRLEEAGVSAVVMYSLFEEQIIHESLELDHYLNYGPESSAEATSFLPEMSQYRLLPEVYLDNLHHLKQTVGIPVIGSLNGVSTGGWIQYAQKIEQAGADALELNIYYLPTNPEVTSQELEDTYVQLVGDVRAKVKIPLAVKLSPYFTALPNLARRLVKAGANGLVLFNRFYQPDFDLEELKVVPNLELSTSQELRLPLRWISLLYGRLEVDFALTSGVHTAIDVVKGLMAGANVTMTTSELLKQDGNAPARAAEMLAQLQAWMEERQYDSVTQMRGSMSEKGVGVASGYERVNYMKVLSSFKQLP